MTNIKRSSGGWTFVEMLIAVSLSSVCLGAGVLALESISTNSKRTTNIVTLNIGQTNNQTFFGNQDAEIRTFKSPNFGRLAFAQEVRERLISDATEATAVFCLPRDIPNTLRPDQFAIGGDRLNLDSPDSFRRFLIATDPTATAIFGNTSYRCVPPADRPNTSIFLLGSSNVNDTMNVIAIYDIDFIRPTNVAGEYASVKRYVGQALTHYYDVFYDDGPGDRLYPQFVAFEQERRQLANENQQFGTILGANVPISAFQIAPTSPFYMIWLPDPTINPMETPAWTAPVDPVTSPRAVYEHLTRKTSFGLVLPMFPPF